MKKVVKILTLVLVLFSIVFSNVSNMNVYAAEYPDNPDTLPIVHYVKNETSGLLYGAQLDPSYAQTPSQNSATTSAIADVSAPSGKVMRVYATQRSFAESEFIWGQHNLYNNTNYTVEYVVKNVGGIPVKRYSRGGNVYKQDNIGSAYVTIRDTFTTSKGNISIEDTQVIAGAIAGEDWRLSVAGKTDLRFMSIKYTPNTPVITVKDQTLTINLSDVKGKNRADIVKIYEEQIKTLLNQSSIDTNNNNNPVLATVNNIPDSQTVIHSSADEFSVDILAEKWGEEKNGKLNIEILDNSPAQQPEMNPIKETDKEITGKGTPGDEITVRDPNGIEIGKTPVDQEGNWKVEVPNGMKLTPGDEITATAKQPGSEKESDPAKQVVTANEGIVSIDYASNLDFGKQKITSADKVYKAAAQKFTDTRGEGPNYVQVTDNRGTEKGWSLQVKQNGQFKSDSGKELTGAEITFNNGVVNTVSESQKPSIVKSSFSLTPEGTGVAENIMSAKAGEGAGTHVLAFGADTNAADSIELSVPGKTTKYAEKYNTSLTWTLTDVPGQE